MSDANDTDGFSSDWLALREPADHAARAAMPLPDALTDRSSLRVVDLGSGTGSNLRYLTPRLGEQQHWRLIDNDPLLLGAMPARLADWARRQALTVTTAEQSLTLQGERRQIRIQSESCDLAQSLTAELFADTDLVTCSALLDLFSRDHLDALAAAVANAGVCALFSLSYDGRVDWHPTHPVDALAIELLNAHQRRDKGLGRAAGPDAAAIVAEALRAQGLQVSECRTDWTLDATSTALQQELLDGWLRALLEQAPQHTASLQDWYTARSAFIADQDSRLTVGHVDVLALPGKDH